MVDSNAYPSSGGQPYALIVRDVGPRCQSPQDKKAGHVHNGKQYHHCHDCDWPLVDCFAPYRISEVRRALSERWLAATLKWMERVNNLLRQRVSRLVRDAWAFSTKLATHVGAITLFRGHYPLARATAESEHYVAITTTARGAVDAVKRRGSAC